MNRTPALLSLSTVVALVVGLVIGYALGQGGVGTRTGAKRATTPAAENVVEVFRKAARPPASQDDARQACIKEKLGAERYAALALNPNAATAEDQFKILPCYQP